MNRNACLIVCLATVCFTAFADRVVLRDGQVFEGRILSETEYEVELETARNQTGTIRTIQILRRDAVQSMARGEEVVTILPDLPEEQQVISEPVSASPVLDIPAAHTWLDSSSGLLESGKYDEAIARFKQVANDSRLMEQSRRETAEARPALELRIRSYKLWMTAVKGKREFIETNIDQKEDAAEQHLEKAEERLRQYRKQNRYSAEKQSKTVLRSKQRRILNPEQELADEVSRAEQVVAEFERWKREGMLEIQNLESEYDLLREQLKQLEKELKSR